MNAENRHENNLHHVPLLRNLYKMTLLGARAHEALTQ